MRVHHLNCISSCPLGGGLLDGRSVASTRGRLACHCLLLETDRELILVDTGFGLRDCEAPRTRLGKFFLALTSPEFRVEMTAIRQIEALGFDPQDVRHIVLSHLDFDHAGGLDDFPHAQVHMLRAERDTAAAQATALDRMRYRPQQWGTRANWLVYDESNGESWLGFGAVRDLHGLPPEILLVPLPGHTIGHAGVALRTGDGWLLYAGDAYFHCGEMDLERPHCPPGLRLYQAMMAKDRKLRLGNQHRLRELRRAHDGELMLFCSHDVTEFERMAHRPFDRPHRPTVVPIDSLSKRDVRLRARRRAAPDRVAAGASVKLDPAARGETSHGKRRAEQSQEVRRQIRSAWDGRGAWNGARCGEGRAAPRAEKPDGALRAGATARDSRAYGNDEV